VTAVLAGLMLAAGTSACASDGSGDAAPGEVDAASAFVAMIEWQTGEQEPVVTDAGETELPVIYVVAAAGETIDVGVQAAVAEATVDMATVRFADEATDAFDDDLDGEPVRDQGSMLLVGAIPVAAPTIVVDLVRYVAADRPEPFQLEITADDLGPGTIGQRSAIVTSATSPTE